MSGPKLTAKLRLDKGITEDIETEAFIPEEDNEDDTATASYSKLPDVDGDVQEIEDMDYQD